ncbi:uncharacterized protein wu:fc46h12 isoform X2 [Fundulus heteroclitus]|uniref:uncharacterized protein wu:fc46h12 isoform X2 n=1 Tax=Fundulus heteroclitus TaxID=8078 RepID=UPI00165C7B44|nr:uncharacterized protein wu:fc46h12 isoform X2 [Fundulus heteroclitus]
MDSRLIFFFTSALIAAAAVAASLSGSTAQCKIKWLFGIDCGDVSGKLVNQIQAWQVKESCVETGEKCSYELVSSAPYLIKATHTSPRTKKLNSLQFLLEQSTVCKVTGEASSEGSRDQADNSTNFCSLQNLMNGSRLTDAEGYKQFSNKWICPGFDTASCSLD